VTGLSQSGSRGAGIAAVALALTGFSWGFILTKLIGQLGMPPPELAFWRLLIGSSVLIAIALAWRVPWPQSKLAVILAGLAFGAHQLLYITATQWTSVAIVALIGATQPLLIALVSHRTVGERVPRAVLGCAVLALAGVAVVVHANLHDSSRSLRGDLIAVVNVFAVTAYFLVAKRARVSGAPTLTLTAGVLFVALLVVAPAAAWGGVTAPGDRQWIYLLLLALGSGNGHLLLNWAHRRVSAALAALILALLPVLTAVWAHLVLGEPLGWRHGVGIVLVVAAIELGRRAEASGAAAEAASP